MSEPEASQAAPAGDAEQKPPSVAPSAENEKAPIWAQCLAIAVIVTGASAYLLSDRQQEPTSEARPVTTNRRAAPVEEPDVPDQAPDPEDMAAPARGPVAPGVPTPARGSASPEAPAVKASASPHEPTIERAEPPAE